MASYFIDLEYPNIEDDNNDEEKDFGEKKPRNSLYSKSRFIKF